VIAQVKGKIQEGRLTDAPSLKFMLEAFELLLAEIRRSAATH
jgi:hypothetical protein